MKERGLEDARISSEWLLAHLLGKSRAELYVESAEVLSEEKKNWFFDLIEKRAAHYPVQYLIGEVSFRKISLNVKPGVLIPRPETEILVDVVLNRLREFGEKKPVKILDIGTGTGCLAISFAREIENALVTATDVSEMCTDLACANAIRNGAEKKISFKNTNLWDQVEGPFDIVASNPPYLSKKDLSELMPEVQYEPVLALDGGETGLNFYRRIIENVSSVLAPNGFLVFEVGLGQSKMVRELLNRNGFGNIEITKDLTEIERIVSAKLIQ